MLIEKGWDLRDMEFRELIGALVLSVAMVVAVVLTYMMFWV